MNPSSLDIAEFIENDATLTFKREVDIFTNRMPNTPQTVICLYDGAGEGPMVQFSKAGSRYYYPELSLRVRDITYELAYNKALVLMELLHAEHAQTINSTYYALIKAKADPHLLHYDENDRPVMVVNFSIQRREDNT